MIDDMDQVNWIFSALQFPPESPREEQIFIDVGCPFTEFSEGANFSEYRGRENFLDFEVYALWLLRCEELSEAQHAELIVRPKVR